MTLFVTGLPYDMDDTDLKEMFELYGEVKSAKIALDKETRKSRGFGFVEMPNREEGLDSFHALVEATVQRSRPVVLTALAAVLAFIPLTLSVFWGSLAFTLIGGTAVGTVLTLVFLPALYSIWFRVIPSAKRHSSRELATR